MRLIETYPLHYTSAERPGDDSPWTVYVEQYADPSDAEPIDGSTERVSTWPTEAEANSEARRLQIAATLTRTQRDALTALESRGHLWPAYRGRLAGGNETPWSKGTLQALVGAGYAQWAEHRHGVMPHIIPVSTEPTPEPEPAPELEPVAPNAVAGFLANANSDLNDAHKSIEEGETECAMDEIQSAQAFLSMALSAVSAPTPEPTTTTDALLAKFDEWRDGRADLSAAEADGGADWSDSDDDGCNLADELADHLRALTAALAAQATAWHKASDVCDPGRESNDSIEECEGTAMAGVYTEAARAIEKLLDLTPAPVTPAEQECPRCEGVGYFPDASPTGDDADCTVCAGNGYVTAA